MSDLDEVLTRVHREEWSRLVAVLTRLFGDLDVAEEAAAEAFAATRADLLRRLGRSADARAAYDRAIGLARNSAESSYLSRRRDELGTSGAAT
jgi:predicted RNA polymerase sigma factor